MLRELQIIRDDFQELGVLMLCCINLAFVGLDYLEFYWCKYCDADKEEFLTFIEKVKFKLWIELETIICSAILYADKQDYAFDEKNWKIREN